ncbi:peptidase MA family metallohydrolase [Anaeromyxobacter oryzisoli]|uniref:peptidase MA family metallohydrolase n=1 Tax=Anaeromyxobacter oryzisoli TaxID=2925408 RepID=UPI001F564E15|nr:tetratricopeptide repeat protein [Anaeromyxobacter sp. SG63]
MPARRALAAVLLGAALAAAAPAPALAAGAADKAAIAALRRLSEEDVDAARRTLAPYQPFDRASDEVKLAAGVLRFFEQDYGAAVRLIEASGAGDAGGYLALAKAAREVTKDFVRFEAEHFVVSYPKGKDEVLVPYLVEALERQRAALQAAVGVVPAGRLTVEIVPDVRALARISTLTEAEVRTSGTVAVAKFGKLMMLSPKALLKGYDWLDTAAHEYTHVVVTLKTHNRAPIWLQEGLAKWFETAWRGRAEPLTPFSAALVRDAVGKGNLVTFQEMHPSLAKLPSQERAALAYAQVVLAVEYLVNRAGPAAIARVTAAVGGGRTAEQAVADALGVPFERFLGQWKGYLASRPLPRGGAHELRRLTFRDDPRQRADHAEWGELADPTARGFARLGEIYRIRGRWNAARIEYGKAYRRVGGRVANLSGQYALAAAMAGQRDEASRVLTEALGWNPDYPALNVQLARLLLERQDLARARDRLLVANRQDPFDPEIHAGLAKAYGGLGDPGAASREARFATILSARDGHSP